MEQERKTSCGAGAPLACGREPFMDDSVCDRGDVDIHAFDDFPLCSIVDPTPPDVAPPQVDFPVVPIPPPPCACVFVDVQGGGEVEDRDDLLVSADFNAIGDCCEGNYQMDIDIRIPCMPFDIVGGSDSHPVDIEMDCTAESPEGTFNLGITAEDCVINIEPKLKLKIPKTPEIKLKNPEVEIREVGCEGFAGEFETTVESGDCKREYSQKLTLSVPHIVQFDTCEDWTVTMEDPSEGKKLGGAGTFDVNLDKDSCCDVAKFICPELKLSLPCPLPNEDLKVKARLEWSGEQSGEATVAAVGEADCGMEAKVETLELGLPCPIDDIVILPSVRWESSEAPQQSSTVLRRTEDCTFTGGDALDIAIPCALDNLEIVGALPESDGDPYIIATKVEDSESETSDGCHAKWELKIVMPHGSSSPSEEFCELIAISGLLDGFNQKTETLYRSGPGNVFPVEYSRTDPDGCIISVTVDSSDSDPSKYDVRVVSNSGSADTYFDQPPYGFGIKVNIIDLAGKESEATIVCTDASSSPSSSSSSEKSSGSSGSAGSSGSSGKSGGSGSPEPPEPKVDSFVAVTDVRCSEKGGIEVISSTFTIDFTNGKVSSAENVTAKGPEAANMARRIFATTIEALRKDPSLASIVDDPYSEEARMALARLGFADGIAEYREDDSFIEEWRNSEWEP